MPFHAPFGGHVKSGRLAQWPDGCKEAPRPRGVGRRRGSSPASGNCGCPYPRTCGYCRHFLDGPGWNRTNDLGIKRSSHTRMTRSAPRSFWLSQASPELADFGSHRWLVLPILSPSLLEPITGRPGAWPWPANSHARARNGMTSALKPSLTSLATSSQLLGRGRGPRLLQGMEGLRDDPARAAQWCSPAPPRGGSDHRRGVQPRPFARADDPASLYRRLKTRAGAHTRSSSQGLPQVPLVDRRQSPLRQAR